MKGWKRPPQENREMSALNFWEKNIISQIWKDNRERERERWSWLMTREDTFWRAIGWRPETRKMHNFPLDKVFGSWFVCTPENCSFVHIRRVMSTCQHVKRCFACRDGSYVLGADVLLISWRVRRSRVARSNMVHYVTNLGVQGNMNVITPPTSTPTSPHAWSGCSAGVCKGTWTPTPPHPPNPNPNPSLAWRVRMYACGVRQWVILGVRRCVLLACADGSFALEARVEWTRMHMWCHW